MKQFTTIIIIIITIMINLFVCYREARRGSQDPAEGRQWTNNKSTM